MYLNSFSIGVISQHSQQIVNVIQTLAPLEDSEYQIQASSKETEEILKGMPALDSLVILDRRTEDLELCKKAQVGRIALIISQDALAGMADELLQKVDDLWILPENCYDEKLLSHYFTQTITVMKQQADYRKLQISVDSAIDSVPNLVWFKDLTGAHLKVNDVFCKASNKTREQIFKKQHAEIWEVPREEEGEFSCYESEKAVVEAGKTCTFDEKVKTQQGMKMFKTYKSPLIDKNGEIFGTCGIAMDITDLRNVGNQVDVLLEGMPFGILLVDKDNKIVSVNHKIKFYLHENEQTIEEVIDQDYQTWKADILEKNFEIVEQKEEHELVLRLKQQPRYIRMKEEPILDAFGDEIGCSVFMSDVTSEWSFQEELRKEVEKQNRKAILKQKQVERLYTQAVQALASTIDAKDKYTNGHSMRVAEYAREIARRLDMTEKEQEDIYHMGLLHDIGKIGIPDEIINKPSRLTNEEYAIIKTHPVVGADILKNMTESPEIVVGARWHHERYDGKGYPDGLKGNEIPIMARIIGVADAYDAMTSTRSYRCVLPIEVVKEEIEKGKGTQFDPLFADVMLSIIEEEQSQIRKSV